MATVSSNGFIDIQFPTDISIDSSGGPEFSTLVNSNRFKGEFRHPNWQTPRRRYSVGYGLKHKSQVDALMSFFNICKGKAFSFRYKDWMDYQAINVQIGIGDGSTVIFNLLKKYTFNGLEYQRLITKPVDGTISVFVDNGIVSPANFTASLTTGAVQLSSPPASGSIVTANFDFDTHVRFDTDSFNVKKDGTHSYSVENLSLVEVVF